MVSLSCKINDLDYGTVERCITDFFDMGYAESSNLPIELSEKTYGNYYISATKKLGEFSIRINEQKDGSYWLYAYPSKLKNKK